MSMTLTFVMVGNWWCFRFKPGCFAGSQYEISDSIKKFYHYHWFYLNSQLIN